MTICDEAWDEFMLYANAIMYGSSDYNDVVTTKKKGSTRYGKRDVDIFDVFNFWREEILSGQPYSTAYLDQIETQAIMEEARV